MNPVEVFANFLLSHTNGALWALVYMVIASILNWQTNTPDRRTILGKIYYILITIPSVSVGKALQTGLPAGMTGQQAIETVVQDAGQQILTYVLSQLPAQGAQTIPPADTTEVPLRYGPSCGTGTLLEPLPVHSHSSSAATHGPLVVDGPIEAERIAASSTLAPDHTPAGDGQAGHVAGGLLATMCAILVTVCLCLCMQGCASFDQTPTSGTQQDGKTTSYLTWATDYLAGAEAKVHALAPLLPSWGQSAVQGLDLLRQTLTALQAQPSDSAKQAQVQAAITANDLQIPSNLTPEQQAALAKATQTKG